MEAGASVSKEFAPPPPRSTPCRGAKSALCWASALLLWGTEAYIHIRCGFGKRIYEEEGACAGLPRWRGGVHFGWEEYLSCCEGICRSGISVAAAGLIWENGLALARGAGVPCAAQAVKNDGDPVVITVQACWSCLTLALGVYAIVAEERDVPEWVACYTHFFEIGCHTIVTTALVGLLADLCQAFTRRQLCRFACNFVTCQDTVEAHTTLRGCRDSASAPSDDESQEGGWDCGPTAGPDSAPAGGEAARAGGACLAAARGLLLWTAFLATLHYYILEQRGERLPRPLVVLLELLGVLCWGGIAWSLAGFAGSLLQGDGDATPWLGFSQVPYVAILMESRLRATGLRRQQSWPAGDLPTPGGAIRAGSRPRSSSDCTPSGSALLERDG